MTLVDILLAVLLLSASVLVIYLLLSLIKLNKTIERVENDLHQLTQSSLPILDDVEVITGKISETVDTADEKFQGIKEKIETISNKLSFLKSSDVQVDPEEHISSLVTTLRAFFKGVSVFWDNMKNN